ncbi:hypothetical protein [Amycolatopsis sp. PS_44_ISF1]|uniref:hypothetical protein n=1 Tax=Amycolatopsis sp. PS_44_ISF1 TaxID=2974917 RepID=UPI0028DE8B31|nr:hypothetical protein [Amycolatopsis sp. PS_44_ISF1]MDT8911933.1 hypothetical protein [Amycolatopsis sp. PS_44_ISF1]
MLKKIGFLTAAMAAGALLFGGMASASTQSHGWDNDGWDQSGQVGLVNLNNIDVAHNVDATLGLCDNDINVLGVQVPVRDSANGVGLPILSPGKNTAAGATPKNCASGGVADGGSIQHN